MFEFRQINTSFWIRFITITDFDVDWLITRTTDMLSIRNKRLEFAYWLCHKIRAIATVNISKKVRSIFIDFLLLFSKCIKGQACPLFNTFSGRTIQQVLKQYISLLLSLFHLFSDFGYL